MKLKENDVVSLKYDDLDVGVKKEYTGTVLDIQCGEASVEFTDDEGNTLEKAMDKYYPEDDLIVKWHS